MAQRYFVTRKLSGFKVASLFLTLVAIVFAAGSCFALDGSNGNAYVNYHRDRLLDTYAQYKGLGDRVKAWNSLNYKQQMLFLIQTDLLGNRTYMYPTATDYYKNDPNDGCNHGNAFCGTCGIQGGQRWCTSCDVWDPPTQRNQPGWRPQCWSIDAYTCYQDGLCYAAPRPRTNYEMALEHVTKLYEILAPNDGCGGDDNNRIFWQAGTDSSSDQLIQAFRNQTMPAWGPNGDLGGPHEPFDNASATTNGRPFSCDGPDGQAQFYSWDTTCTYGGQKGCSPIQAFSRGSAYLPADSRMFELDDDYDTFHNSSPLCSYCGGQYGVTMYQNHWCPSQGNFASCDWNYTPTPVTYPLSVSEAGSGAGTVTSSPAGITCGATCTGNFTVGALVTLTASPVGGSTFAGWSGACSGTASCAVTMSAAQLVTATFNPAPANYAGCFTDDGNRALPTLLSSGETVESCTQKAAAAGYAYAGLQYYGECWAGNTPGYVQVADAECNTPCSANPREVCGGAWHNSIYRTGVTPSKTLSVAKNGSGTGTVTSNPAGITCGAICTGNFTVGALVTLTASPVGGSTFAGWSGACSGTASCAVTMSAAQTVTATFNVAAAGPRISAVVDGITYSYTISPTTTIAIFGSGFSIGANMVQFQRAGYGDVWLYNGDGHYFWDGNGTQINASLDSRVASGTWNVTVRTSSGGVSSPYTLTIQGNTSSSAYYCYSNTYPSYGYQNWLCNAAYNPTYCYTSAWQWTSCPSSGLSARCGNGICEAGENGSNCGQDCCDQTTVCGQTKQNQGLYYCRNMYHYDNGSAYWHGFQWVTANDTMQMCNESWEAQEGSYYQTQYQCGGYTGKCHSIPGGYY
jgi:hypothetical protein